MYDVRMTGCANTAFLEKCKQDGNLTETLQGKLEIGII